MGAYRVQNDTFFPHPALKKNDYSVPYAGNILYAFPFLSGHLFHHRINRTQTGDSYIRAANYKANCQEKYPIGQYFSVLLDISFNFGGCKKNKITYCYPECRGNKAEE